MAVAQPAEVWVLLGMPRTVRKGLGRSRLLQLQSDLKLSPEARVREAEEGLEEFFLIRAALPEIPEYPPPPTRLRADRVRERPEPVPADKYPTKLALVCSVLNEARAQYVLVGAKAIQVWGTSRITTDIDVLIEPTSQNVERVLTALSRVGFGIAAEITVEEVLSRHVTVIGDTPRVDILTRACNLFWKDAAPRAVVHDFGGVRIPTASIEDLIESKRTGRLKDLADIEVLETIRRELARRAK